MKRLLLFALFLLTSITFSVDAKADVYLKYGAVLPKGDENSRQYSGIWFEQNNCQQCIALFGLETYRGGGVSNRMVGADYTAKLFRQAENEIRLSVGYSVSEKAINNSQQFNFHLGAGFVIKDLLFSKYDLIFFYDHFSNGRTVLDRDQIELNVPLDMLSIGFGF